MDICGFGLQNKIDEFIMEMFLYHTNMSGGKMLDIVFYAQTLITFCRQEFSTHDSDKPNIDDKQSY